MKSWSKLFVTTLVLTTSLAPLSAMADTTHSFGDLTKAASWAQSAITKAQALNLVSGDDKGNFRPLDHITRAEVAVVLSRALQLSNASTTTSSFHDVKVSDWYHNAIEAVAKAGLMLGDGTGNIRPNDPITRQELAVLLVKAANGSVKGNDLSTIGDKGQVAPWARGYVQAAMELGLMQGDGKNFNPQALATRQEVAALAVRLVDKLGQNTATPVISSITEDGQVVIDGTTYQAGDAVKGIFSKANAAVLQGAKITFEKDGSTLTKITSLELTKSGQAAAAGQAEFSGDLVFDGQGGTIDGTLKISADYISVLHLKVGGDFVITPALQDNFYSDGLQVTGKTLVQGGAPDTVVFNNARLSDLYISKNAVHVDEKGNTAVNSLVVESNANITADPTVTIPKVVVKAGADSVQLTASVGSLEVQNSGAKLQIDPHVKIGTLVLPDGQTPETMIANYADVKSLITKIVSQKADGTQVDVTPTPAPVPAPVPSNGGGGSNTGGGGGGGTTTTSNVVSAVATSTTSVNVTFDQDQKYWPNTSDFSFDTGLKIYDMIGQGGTFKTFQLITAPQEDGKVYKLLYKGKDTGITVTGIAPQKTGHVTMSDGITPAKNVKLSISNSDMATHLYEYLITDDQGNFAVSNMQEGVKYSIHLDQVIGADDVPQGDVDYTYSPTTDLPAISFKQLQVSGHVMSVNGQTPQGYSSVELMGPPGSNFYRFSETDTTGTFRFTDLTVGTTYTLLVDPPYGSDAGVVSPAPVTFTYTGPGQKIADIKLATPNLTGKVLLPSGGSIGYDQNRYDIQQVGSPDYTEKIINDDGTFSLFLPDGTYKLTYSANDDLLLDPDPVTLVVANRVVNIPNVQLQLKTAERRGQITNPNGDTMYNMHMTVTDTNGNVVMDRDLQKPEYKIGGLSAGDYHLKITEQKPSGYYEPYEEDFTITDPTAVVDKDVVIPNDQTPPVLTVTSTKKTDLLKGDFLTATNSEGGEMFLVPDTYTVTSEYALSSASGVVQAVFPNGQNAPGATGTFDTYDLTAGTYHIYAYDKLGNVAKSDTINVLADYVPDQLTGTANGSLYMYDRGDGSRLTVTEVQDINPIKVSDFLNGLTLLDGATAKITSEFSQEAVSGDSYLSKDMVIRIDAPGMEQQVINLNLTDILDIYSTDSSVWNPSYFDDQKRSGVLVADATVTAVQVKTTMRVYATTKVQVLDAIDGNEVADTTPMQTGFYVKVTGEDGTTDEYPVEIAAQTTTTTP